MTEEILDLAVVELIVPVKNAVDLTHGKRVDLWPGLMGTVLDTKEGEGVLETEFHLNPEEPDPLKYVWALAYVRTDQVRLIENYTKKPEGL